MKKQILIKLMAIVIVSLLSLASAFAQPSINLTMPKTNLAPEDSLILDLEMQSGGSTSNVDFYFSLEVGLFTFYLNQKLTFTTSKEPVISNSKPIDFKVRLFGPGTLFLPSVFGEVKIPPGTNGTFTWVAEIFDSESKISFSKSQITFTVSPSVSIPVTTTTTTSTTFTTSTTTTIPTPKASVILLEAKLNVNRLRAPGIGDSEFFQFWVASITGKVLNNGDVPVRLFSISFVVRDEDGKRIGSAVGNWINRILSPGWLITFVALVVPDDFLDQGKLPKSFDSPFIDFITSE